jgi:thiosulfate/3-mercaptopyruvate sulfurtransferase
MGDAIGGGRFLTLSAYVHPELLVESDWVANHLGDPNLRLVDCRYYFDGRDGHAVYLAGHLPGAVHASYPTDLADSTATPANLLPTPEQVAATMGRLGIGNDTLVVGYDDEGGHFASRLWLVLRYYGHDRMQVLNGGIQKWQAEGRRLATGPVTVAPMTFRPGAPREELRVRGDALRDQLGNPGLVLLDVRRRSEFVGEEVRAGRGGRIPGARLLFWQDNLNPDWTFRAPDEIRERNEAAGVAPGADVVTYCQGGVRAAHAAFALRLVGYDNVRVYDGSWAEWGNRPELPIEKGE